MEIEQSYVIAINHERSIEYTNQCLRSCWEHNIPAAVFFGFEYPLDESGYWQLPNVSINPALANDEYREFLNEALCSASHIALWKKIASSHEKAVAIFEHDVIAYRSLEGIDVQDGYIVYLGYRLKNKEDYQPVSDPYQFHETKMFGGTHAYAITPNTARHLLYTLTRKDLFARKCDNCRCVEPYQPVCSADWWLGHNMLGVKALLVADPAPVAAVVGSRPSTIQRDGRMATFNCLLPNKTMPPAFTKSLINYQDYYIDLNMGLQFFLR